jgi:hypothetical protein
MGHGAFATVIDCIDGRTKQVVQQWMKEFLPVDYVDVITEPGPDKVILQASNEELEAIQRKVGISIHAHGSQVVAIAAHHDCAGNPVSREVHL